MPDLSSFVVPGSAAASVLVGRWLYYRLIWRIYRAGGSGDAVAVARAMRSPLLAARREVPPTGGPDA